MLPFLDPTWIHAAGSGEFWFTATVAWGISLAGFLLTFGFLRRLRVVEDTPRSLIRSAAQGYVELQGEGRLMPGDPILAPLTGIRCLWWSFHIEERATDGKGHPAWDRVDSGVSGELFCINDGTGQCIVDPDGAVVYPSVKQVWYGNTGRPEGGPQIGTLAIASRYRYTEERMHESDTLYALGYFHTQGPVTGADIDEEVRQQLVEWKRDQAELIRRFDTNHDGQVDMQEWDAARQEARRLVLEQERENMKRPPVNVLKRPPDGRAFLLSTLPQNKLEARLKLYIGAGLLAFFVAGAVGAYLLSVRLS